MEKRVQVSVMLFAQYEQLSTKTIWRRKSRGWGWATSCSGSSPADLWLSFPGQPTDPFLLARPSKFWRDSFFCRHAQSVRALLCVDPTPISSYLLWLLPSLQIIVVPSAGVDHIDLSECGHRRIAVTNAGAAFCEDVADYAVALLIDVLRRVSAGDRYVRSELWPQKGDYPLGSRVQSYNLSSKSDWLSVIIMVYQQILESFEVSKCPTQNFVSFVLNFMISISTIRTFWFSKPLCRITPFCLLFSDWHPTQLIRKVLKFMLIAISIELYSTSPC